MIRAIGAKNITIKNSQFKNISALVGGLAYLENSNLNIESSSINSLEALSSGAVFYIDTSNLSISDCNITNVTSSYGPAVFA